MLSQKKLLAVAAAIGFIALSLSILSVNLQAAEIIRGTGVQRATADDCLRDLPSFNLKLKHLGLKLVKPTECVEIQGEAEAYAPTFEAVAAGRVIAETAAAGIFESREGCDRNLSALLGVVADSSETIVEAACVPVTVVSQEEDEMETGKFQPMVFLLKSQH